VKAIVSSNWSGSRRAAKRYKFARPESSLRWRYICTVTLRLRSSLGLINNAFFAARRN
jgi:hypothetical protein